VRQIHFDSKKFREIVRIALDSDKIVLATLSKKFVKKYKDKGQIYYLTRENFDEIYNRVLTQIK